MFDYKLILFQAVVVHGVFSQVFYNRDGSEFIAPQEVEVEERTDVEEIKLLGQPCTEEKKFIVVFMTRGSNRALCAGTLLNERHVLTAAHCSLAWLTQKVRVVVGISLQDLSNLENVHVRAANALYTHPHYFLISNDIMVVRLNTPVSESANVEYVTLPEAPVMNIEEICKTPTLLGWTMGTNNDTEAEVLLCAQLKILPLSKCRESYKKYGDLQIDDSMMCTQTDQMDACYGDSGAPLMCGDVQYGVVSWSIGCTDELPGVFTRVDPYVGFIRDVFENVIEPRMPVGGEEMHKGSTVAAFVLSYCMYIILS